MSGSPQLPSPEGVWEVWEAGPPAAGSQLHRTSSSSKCSVFEGAAGPGKLTDPPKFTQDRTVQKSAHCGIRGHSSGTCEPWSAHCARHPGARIKEPGGADHLAGGPGSRDRVLVPVRTQLVSSEGLTLSGVGVVTYRRRNQGEILPPSTALGHRDSREHPFLDSMWHDHSVCLWLITQPVFMSTHPLTSHPLLITAQSGLSSDHIRGNSSKLTWSV